MRVALVSPGLHLNGAGRSECLYRTLKASSVVESVAVLSTDGSGTVWPPLRGTEFAERASHVSSVASGQRAVRALEADGQVDAVLCVKPQSSTLGVSFRVADVTGAQLLIDMDDDDLHNQMRGGRPLVRLGVGRPKEALAMRHPLPRLKCQRLIRRSSELGIRLTVSNPVLQDVYGGQVVPHVRDVTRQSDVRSSDLNRIDTLVVSFVGTVRPHKGIDVLRRAVDQLCLSGVGAVLIVTGEPPADSKVHERWVGTTSWERGQSLVRDSDVVGVPSLDTHHARTQFPVKLLDALNAGVPVAASDLPVMRWVGGDLFEYAAPGDADSLAAAIVRAARRDRTAQRSRSQNELAMRFTPAAAADQLSSALLQTGL